MVFKKLKNSIAYELNGYFIIKNFLDDSQLKTLTAYHNQLNLFADTRVSSYGVYTNNAKDINPETNKQIDSYIKSTCLSSLNQHFKKYKIGGGIFLLKGVGEKIVPMHQDWNMVDESLFTSFAVWCPLVDVDANNGCIHVIPGSHKWFNNIRTSNIDSVFMPLDRVKESLVSIPLQKGDAIVFAHNLFHGSYPNHSNSTRPTICLSVFSENAKQVHFHRDGNVVNLIDSTAGYYVDKLNSEEPKTNLVISSKPYIDEFLLSEDRFWKKYNKSGAKIKIAKWMHFLSK